MAHITNTTSTDALKGCYGSIETPSTVKEWLTNKVRGNIARSLNGVPRTTLNIWGAPGTSKTSIVKSLASEKVSFDGKEQAIEIIDIPLAQIEEMGDILGFPEPESEIAKDGETLWVATLDSVIKTYLEKGYVKTGNTRMRYAKPAWVPTQAKPGIILFDDGNRASQRIMKGLMQLVQDYKTISWDIPAGWTIVFTGNPDNRYNQVTSMDTAQLTRMEHITLQADAKDWAVWATANGIDSRGINFMLRYPEMMIGKERTNPRSLTQFFYNLSSYPDLNDAKQLKFAMIDANAVLDEETVGVMMTFLSRDCELVISPEEILAEPEKAAAALDKLMGRNEPRVDILAVTMDRLYAHFTDDGMKITEEIVENFRKWMLNERVPRDLVYATMNQIAQGTKHSRKLFKSAELLKYVMDMYKKD